MTRAHSISLVPAAIARQGGTRAGVAGAYASRGWRNPGRSFRRALQQ